MPSIDGFNEMIKDRERRKTRLISRLREAYEPIKKENINLIMDEFSKKQQEYIERKFKDAVTQFYNNYDPEYYIRLGNKKSESGGLYDIVNVGKAQDETGQVDFERGIDQVLDEDRAPMGRNGYDDIYEKVFKGGWHGGAEGINAKAARVWGAHPDPGTPYYRKPGMVYLSGLGRVWHKYGRWGRKAVQDEMSPYDVFRKQIEANEEKDSRKIFFDICDKRKEEKNKIVMGEMIPRVLREV